MQRFIYCIYLLILCICWYCRMAAVPCHNNSNIEMFNICCSNAISFINLLSQSCAQRVCTTACQQPNLIRTSYTHTLSHTRICILEHWTRCGRNRWQPYHTNAITDHHHHHHRHPHHHHIKWWFYSLMLRIVTPHEEEDTRECKSNIHCIMFFISTCCIWKHVVPLGKYILAAWELFQGELKKKNSNRTGGQAGMWRKDNQITLTCCMF